MKVGRKKGHTHFFVHIFFIPVQLKSASNCIVYKLRIRNFCFRENLFWPGFQQKWKSASNCTECIFENSNKREVANKKKKEEKTFLLCWKVSLTDVFVFCLKVFTKEAKILHTFCFFVQCVFFFFQTNQKRTNGLLSITLFFCKDLFRLVHRNQRILWIT